jgi:hypothetical protein
MEKATAAWMHGVNSVRNPWGLPDDQLKWAVNATIRGGIAQTRPGQKMRLSLPAGNFQGGVVFSANRVYQSASSTTVNGVVQTTPATIYNYDGTQSTESELSYIVFAVDGNVYFSPFPLTQPKDWQQYRLKNIHMDANVNKLYFCVATQSAELSSGGDVTVTPSHRVLMIQDGISTPAYWDGSDSYGAESSAIPIGKWMAYSGNRLWVSSGNIVLASDLGNPISWKERVSGVSRGDFSFARPITAMVDYIGQNNDTKLYIFTDRSTYSIASGVLDRNQWTTIANFVTTLYPNIGCIAGNSIAFQAGMMWWYSQGGLISADVAASAYLSSQVLYKDVEMARAKRYMAADYTNICAASFENYLMHSIPYLETMNSATMVLDYAPASEWNQSRSPAWSGVWTGTRPIMWSSGVINGTPRIFQFSVDYAPTNDGSFNHVWECFMPERYDTYLSMNPDGTTTEFYNRIYSSIETALLGDKMDKKQFIYAELDACQIGGTVDLNVSFRGSKGSYIPILKKRLLAATNKYQYETSPSADVINDLGYLRTQYRRLVTETSNRNSKFISCESPDTLDVDKAFSLLIEWCGEMGIEAVRMFLDPWSDKSHGSPNSDETNYCVVGEDGSSITVDLPDAPQENPAYQSQTWASTQSYTATTACNSGTHNVSATATASFISSVSLADAKAQALALATQEAIIAAKNNSINC